MRQFILSLIIFIAMSQTSLASDRPQVMLETSLGTIIVELYRDHSPKTVKNFLDYTESAFYDDFIFHRVIKDWVIQTGAYDRDMVEYETNGPIRNEAANGLKNERGTLAMARYDDPHSADSQFYINLSDNHSLDHKARTMTDYGYCVFGKVIEGMDIVDAIGSVDTHVFDGVEDVPVEPVMLIKATILSD
jgi:peptidyl-prolyl cis-trans isomerase B (cyclophilin B)